MTEKDFSKKRFTSHEEIIYKTTLPHVGEIETACMLLGVDFIQGLFKLLPFPNDYSEQNPFWARCENCNRPTPKPQKVK